MHIGPASVSGLHLTGMPFFCRHLEKALLCMPVIIVDGKPVVPHHDSAREDRDRRCFSSHVKSARYFLEHAMVSINGQEKACARVRYEERETDR